MRRIMLFVAVLITGLGTCLLQVGTASAAPRSTDTSALQTNHLEQSNSASQSGRNSSETFQLAPATNFQPQLAFLGWNGGSSVVSSPSSTTEQGVSQPAVQVNKAAQSGKATSSGTGPPPDRKTGGDDHGTPKADDHGKTAGDDHGKPKADDHGKTAGDDHGKPKADDHGKTAG